MIGVKFGYIHSYRDLDLILSSTVISSAEPKLDQVEIPATDGILDLSTALTNGDIKYNMRTITWLFKTKTSPRQFNALSSRIRNAIEGQSFKIIEDRDPHYYWEGRVTVGEITADGDGGTVTITASVKPYKTEIDKGADWTWDDFDFENGSIRDYKNLECGEVINVYGLRKWVPLRVEVHSGVIHEIEWDGESYPVSWAPGSHQKNDLIFKYGMTSVKFIGSAVFDLEYVGGAL